MNCVGLLVVLVFTFNVKEIYTLPENLKQMASAFLKEIEACKTELGIKDSILTEIYRLWKEEYDGLTRETGCLLNCMTKKHDIFHLDGKLHHENTKDFAMKNGADENVASQIVSLVHECEKKLGEIDDECIRTLELTKCVRGNIGQIKWTPKVEILVGDIISEE